jgi:hypothetical protein
MNQATRGANAMSTALRTYFRGRNLVSLRDQSAGKM